MILIPLVTDLVWDALRNLGQFIQFKKHEKHPWESVTFNKVAGFSSPKISD